MGNADIRTQRFLNALPNVLHLDQRASCFVQNAEPFAGQLADGVVRELYEQEETRSQIFAALAILAVIGCLGLFALAAFKAERCTKVLGSGAAVRVIQQVSSSLSACG